MPPAVRIAARERPKLKGKNSPTRAKPTRMTAAIIVPRIAIDLFACGVAVGVIAATSIGPIVAQNVVNATTIVSLIIAS